VDHETHALAYYAAHLSAPPQPILFHQPNHHTRECFSYSKPAINRAAAALTADILRHHERRSMGSWAPSIGVWALSRPCPGCGVGLTAYSRASEGGSCIPGGGSPERASATPGYD
jgi:hypothetical protein